MASEPHLRRNSDLGRNVSTGMCHQCSAINLGAVGVCRVLITCRCAALRQWPVGGSPDVPQSLSRVDLQRRDFSPSVREGDPAGAPTPPGCNGRPVMGSHSHPREEECSHRLTIKEICPSVERSAQALLPECLRNATQNENALLSPSIISCIVARIPTWGATWGQCSNK